MEGKSLYDSIPERIIKYTNTSYIVNFSITEIDVENEDTNQHKMYECDYIIVDGEVTKGSLVEALIRRKYTVSDEFAVLRQMNTKVDGYNEYNDYAEGCKKIADEVLNNKIV